MALIRTISPVGPKAEDKVPLTITNTTNKTNWLMDTIKAGSLSTIKSIQGDIAGLITTANVSVLPSVTIELIFGSLTIPIVAAESLVKNLNNVAFHLEFEISNNDATNAQTITATLNGFTTAPKEINVSGSVDTTVGVFLRVASTFSSILSSATIVINKRKYVIS